MNEFSPDKIYSKGDSGPYVWIIQEWLCLHGISVVIDGSFGVATEAAVKKFQVFNSLEADGVVGENTYKRLIQPLTNALRPIQLRGKSLGTLVVEYARQHLRQHPLEIGSRNMGPWVRHYMRGNQGSEWPWAAGFVCSIIEQAATRLGVETPLQVYDSCSGLANVAKKKGLYLSERSVIADRSRLKAGFIFLNREFPGYWTHAGIVTHVDDEIFISIEANANDYGAAHGYDVCERIRAYEGKDFIVV